MALSRLIHFVAGVFAVTMLCVTHATVKATTTSIDGYLVNNFYGSPLLPEAFVHWKHTKDNYVMSTDPVTGKHTYFDFGRCARIDNGHECQFRFPGIAQSADIVVRAYLRSEPLKATFNASDPPRTFVVEALKNNSKDSKIELIANAVPTDKTYGDLEIKFSLLEVLKKVMPEELLNVSPAALERMRIEMRMEIDHFWRGDPYDSDYYAKNGHLAFNNINLYYTDQFDKACECVRNGTHVMEANFQHDSRGNMAGGTAVAPTVAKTLMEKIESFLLYWWSPHRYENCRFNGMCERDEFHF